jgi:hypothetical protein
LASPGGAVGPYLALCSFDHLVGAGEQRRRNIKAKGSSSLEVDHQLKTGRLHHRKLGWFSPFRIRPA